MDIASLATIVGVALVALAALAAAFVIIRSSILKQTNEVLTGALAVERGERKETEARCREEIAELRGQVRTLTHEHAKVVAREVIRVFREEGILKEPDRG